MSNGPIRGLLLTEGTLKLIGGSIFILSPHTVLNMVMPSPCPPSALLLTQMLGTQTLTLGVCMLLASSTAPSAIASRRIVYWTVFTRDAALIAVLGWELCFGRSDTALGLTKEGLRSWILEILPFLLGHWWILMRRSGWF
jgi:hypothetical protein